MKKRTVHRWIVLYLLAISLVYIPTVLLWGNIAGLRVLHLDIPPWASDGAFQAKALVNFAAGVVLLTGCTGLLTRQRWGKPITLAGLFCQVSIYVAEAAIFRYLPALGAAVVLIPIAAVIIYNLTKQ